MFRQIRNVLNVDQLAVCRRLIAEAPWIDGRSSAGATAARKKNNSEIAKTGSVLNQLREIVLGALMSRPEFIAKALPARIVSPSFSRYGIGQSYGQHIDAGVVHDTEGGAVRRVRTDLAATLFISEPSEYGGGELMMDDPTYGHGNVKLPAGDMVLYPASSLHWVEPITEGSRLVSFFWIQSLVRETHLRSLLQDLDGTIQQLNLSIPGNTASVKLLGLYHNLLRLWAEPY
jgi:PKHD-type hydroxylase